MVIDLSRCPVGECLQARSTGQVPKDFCWKQYLLSSSKTADQDRGVEVSGCPQRRALRDTYREPFKRARERRTN